jgi:acyl-CoA dehydrogenase
MDFELSPRTQELREHLLVFMEQHIYPNEAVFHEQISEGDRWQPAPIIEELKEKARAEGLWNLWLPKDIAYKGHGTGLKILEYASLCEIMGRSHIAPEVFNCSAPDTGNMETLLRFGTEEQKREWALPLLEGRIRSAIAMTEPAVASSDPTNLQTTILPEGDEYVINGRKWWISGVGDPRCKLLLVMGKSNPDGERHKQHAIIIVPMDAPGVEVVRPLTIFGYDDAPHGHCEVGLSDVHVPASNMLLGEGRGFEIAQGRLGPGRIHHCMRTIGQAERALEAACRRARERIAFGRPIAEQGVVKQQIAVSRMEIDQARLLTLHAAWRMDTVGSKEARKEIGMIKVVAPQMACRVIDRAMQIHGGGGLSDDFHMAWSYSWARTLRLADGPDEVHTDQVARLELRQYN